ncbi:GHKL domain-containing protein [Agathobacter rectalis]|uniref:GHKL domain-containing protein n=1 Tax=Agathobacter rectalis TaxID=39491 RepID=A0A395V5A2_9FIRM|nr:GHKL domain-containing protein [Agathobacter rectalis]
MDFLVFSNISLMATMFFLILSILIHFVWKKEAFVHSLSYTIILLVIPVLSMCLLLSKPILYLNINIPSAFFILAAFVLFINIMNYILFYNVLENEELRFQLTIQKEQIEFQRNKYEQLGAAYKNIRSFMHDTKKHLFYIENCVTEKKYDDIIPYSKEIMHDLESRYCTINTGNLVIDAFVSNLLLQTKAQGITLHTNLKFDKATIPVNDYHLTIILGNLLDNALNACRGQIGANIKVAVRTVDGTFTIHVANTYVIADPDKAPDDFEKIDFIHGYGLKNVKDSAEACGGFCVINHENDIYSATVIIPVLNP